jgi:TRAP-type C4-dicarboxylate transport system permease large subunit
MLPIAVKAGIGAVYFGLMFILNGAIGFVTPPVGTVLNVVAGVGQIRCRKINGTRCDPFLITVLNLLTLFIIFPKW